MKQEVTQFVSLGGNGKKKKKTNKKNKKKKKLLSVSIRLIRRWIK